MCITSSKAERIHPDGWHEFIVPAWTTVSLGDGWIATVTPAAIKCECGKGLNCIYVTKERMGS